MRTLYKIGVRNVRRNIRRTLITVLAIFVGVIVILLTRGLVNGIQNNLKSNVTDVQLGDIQVHTQGYVDSVEGAPLNLSFNAADVSVDELKAAGIENVSGRIMFGGMISKGDVTTMIVAQSIDPANEYGITPRKKSVISKGSALSASDVDGIVLADGLAAALKANVGDTVTILTNTLSGAMNAADFTVVGTMAASSPFENKRAGVVHLDAAQRLLSMRGKVTELALKLPPESTYEQTEKVRDVLRNRLGDRGFEVHTWKDLSPQIADIMKTQDKVLAIVVAVLFFIVLVGIVNTMLMSVFERVREIGTMMAIGMRRPQVIILFLLEALTLGIIGASTGAVAGLGLVALLDRAEILMSAPGASVPQVLRVVVDPSYPVQAMIIAVISALLAALYPAWQASKLKPIDAIRTN